jgi:hypothetical protein
MRDSDDVAASAPAAGGLLGRIFGSGGADKSAKPPRLWPLTPAQQEAFMSYSVFVLHDGLVQLLPRVMPLVQRHTAAHRIDESLTVDQVHASFVWALSQFACVLLPRSAHALARLCPSGHD